MRATTSLEILAIALQGGEDHEHITHLQWQASSSSGVTSSDALIAWLHAGGEHAAWLRHGEQQVDIGVATPSGAPAHLRSRIDGVWSDHLLALPRF